MKENTSKRRAGKVPNITPISDYILVRQDPASKTTEGGIVLPQIAQNKPCCGTVLRVYAPFLTRKGFIQEPYVTVGDKVIFVPYAPKKIDNDGEELLLIRESDIITIWIKDDETSIKK